MSGTLIVRLLAPWCFAPVFVSLYADGTFFDLNGYKKVGLGLTAGVILISFAVFTGLSFIFKKLNTDRVLLPVFFGIYTLFIALSADGWYTLFGLGAAWALLWFYYVQKGWVFVKKDLTKDSALFVIVLSVTLFVILAGATSVLRYLTFSCPNYDFGIFCNMFYNMKAHFTPYTTCERDVYLSHFAVHISPIYYALLPLFCLFSSGVTLQIAQILLLASGVIPVYLIAKKYSLSNMRAAFVSCLFLLSPVLVSGTNYDFHENCFLVPLLLWMFYFFEKEKYVPFGIFAGLTLLVKEDAAVYIAIFALYMIFDRKKVLAGSITALGAVVYFVVALGLLSHFGNGAMTGRYSNFIAGDGGLADMIKNILADPAYVFSQLFVSKDGTFSDKLLFILQMTLPLCFLPFTSKKPSRLILLLPMVLVNLMTLYVYQYRIGYQYAFGSFVFLFYLSILNLSDIHPVTSRAMLNTAAVVTAMCFIFAVLPRFSHYVTLYVSGRENYAAMEELCESIPEDKSVVCSTFLLPHLANRDDVYEIEYHDPVKRGESDYVLIDMRYKTENFIEKYEELGYKITDTLEVNGKELIAVMEK